MYMLQSDKVEHARRRNFGTRFIEFCKKDKTAALAGMSMATLMTSDVFFEVLEHGEEFITEKLPEFFKSMKNLNISISEIEELLKKYVETAEEDTPKRV